MEELTRKLDGNLKTLFLNKKWDDAISVVNELCNILGAEVKDDPFLISDNTKINANPARFEKAEGFIDRPASYEIQTVNGNIEIKLFWTSKVLKSNLSWIVGISPNFEDGKTYESEKYKVGIDIVIPKDCDSVIILVSNNLKVRSLELKEKLSRTDKEIIEKLGALKNRTLVSIEDKKTYHNILWDAFNFEPINRKFYKELVDRFSVLRDHLVSKDFQDQDAVMFSTRLIGRLLFVWFLRKKNLINEKVGYFEATDAHNQTGYYKEKLEKLFFETLNTEILERDFEDNKTPYLNGGLFEATRTDFYNDKKLSFPDGYFSQFYEVLSHYNFTVDESSPEFEQVAVDPEMLGRIFESLLAEQRTETGAQARKAKGAFYTPREIVSYMCEESLKEYLKSKIPDDSFRDIRIQEMVSMSESVFRDQDHNKRRDWKPYQSAVVQALDELTIFDPAVGSGAYPMGMLHLLVKVYTRVDSKYEKNLSKLKRDILSRSLYGSDIDSTAIEISRLRAWLSLVVDMEDGEQVAPLPNLEFHFVCANTLISLSKEVGIFDTPDLKEKLSEIRKDYYNTNSKSKKETLKKKYEKLLAPTSLSLFGGVDNELKTYQPFSHESRASFFDPDLMFGVDKFDVVIGNPPYVQIQKFARTQMQKDLERQNFKTFENTGDIYLLFYEAGINYVKKDTGLLCFITSNKWMRSSYGKSLRNLFTQLNPLILLDLGSNVFESATVDSNILLIKNSKNFKKTLAVTLKNSKEDFIDEIYKNKTIIHFKDDNGWFIENDTVTNLKNKIENSGTSLKNLKVLISKGLMTGCNEAFYIDKELRADLIQKDKNSKDLIFKNFRGREIDKYYTEVNNNQYVIVSSNYINIEDYPAIKKHLLQFEVKLKSRAQFVRGDHEWFTVDNCPSEENLKKYKNTKIIYPNMTQNLCFSIDDSSSFSNDKTFTIVSEHESIKYLCGILNSTTMNFYLRLSLPKLGNKGYEVRKIFFENTPIVVKTFENKKYVERVEKLVDKIIEAKKENKDSDTKELEKEIDTLVYELYGLSEEEIKIIEESK